MKSKLTLVSLMTILACSQFAYGKTDTIIPKQEPYPLYLGITGGWGQTTWSNLVPKDMNDALMTSIPERVTEGGGLFGFYAGYQFIPAFALEMEYMHYPNAKLYFNKLSLFTFEHDGITQLLTRTSAVSLSAKIMMTIPGTPVQAYSRFGAAEVHRDDSIANRWRLSPVFGAGFIYNVTPHVMTELGTEYIAGYGQSELDPAQHYIPFLYSAFFRVGVRV